MWGRGEGGKNESMKTNLAQYNVLKYTTLKLNKLSTCCNIFYKQKNAQSYTKLLKNGVF